MTSTLATVTTLVSAFAVLISAITAMLAVSIQKRTGSADAFIRVYEQFETPAFREYRGMIYRLDRYRFGEWTEEEQAAVNAWCAHLDLAAVLIQSRQLNLYAFLNMYGDVTLRTIYQIAPYCNDQLRIRGKQFLLPLRILTGDLIETWRRLARHKRYPLTIGFPAQPHLRVNPDLFDSDESILVFRVDKKLS